MYECVCKHEFEKICFQIIIKIKLTFAEPDADFGASFGKFGANNVGTAVLVSLLCESKYFDSKCFEQIWLLCQSSTEHLLFNNLSHRFLISLFVGHL